jgi:hypothetical protein
MKTEDRLNQLIAMPMNQAPKKAQQLVEYLSAKYGFCGELVVCAYETYAITIENTEGGYCDNESRLFLESLD